MNTSDCLLWIGHRYTIPRFIEEAQLRGCCRKVPHAPAWLEPGKSRIFLAHQDELAPQHGVIFGYFVLGGVDAVPHGGKGKAPVYEEGGYLSTETVNALLSCDESQEPFTIPYFRALLEALRVCGRRPYESRTHSKADPALYLVDSLTREVDIKFCELVQKLIEEERGSASHPRRVPAKNVKDKVKERRLFEEAIRQAHERLEEHAHPLVLFKEPYPVFSRIPQAAFRGLIEIDGDQLLAEIAETYRPHRQAILGPWRSRWILLPYAQDPEEKLTQAVLVEELAHGCQTNKELAYTFLKTFEDVIVDGLRRKGKVSLFGFGTFFLKRRPATGKETLIPPTKSVQFQPAEPLKAGLPAASVQFRPAEQMESRLP